MRRATDQAIATYVEIAASAATALKRVEPVSYAGSGGADEGKEIMPKSLLAEDELAQLVTSIIAPGGRHAIDQLLEVCHAYVSSADPTGEWRPAEQRYFLKEIVYKDFDLHVPSLSCEGEDVVSADIQFKRPSRILAPLFNRNRPLVNKLLKLLDQLYRRKTRSFPFEHLFISRDEVKNGYGRQVHFGADVRCLATTSFEEWGSECALYDEPFSSGQTDPESTEIRNDFVILRFRRKVF
jgi:hypothetical protein